MHVHTEGRLEGWDLAESPLHLGFPQHPWLCPYFATESCLPGVPRGPREQERLWQPASPFVWSSSLHLLHLPLAVSKECKQQPRCPRGQGDGGSASPDSRGEAGLSVWGRMRLLKPHHWPGSLENGGKKRDQSWMDRQLER